MQDLAQQYLQRYQPPGAFNPSAPAAPDAAIDMSQIGMPSPGTPAGAPNAPGTLDFAQPDMPVPAPAQLPSQQAPLPVAATPEAFIADTSIAAKQDQRAHQQAAQAQAQAAQQDADIAKQESQALDPIYQEQVKDDQRFQVAIQGIQAHLKEQSAIIAQKQQELQQQQEKQIANAPHTIWEQAGMNPVLGAIGLALSSFGSGLSGRPNQALEIITNSINARTARDKQMSDMLAQKGGMLKDEYSQLRQSAGDDTTAELTRKNAYIQQVINQVQQQANLFSSPKAQALANDLKGKLQKQYADNQAAAHQNELTNYKNGIMLGLERDKNQFDMAMQASKPAGGAETFALGGFKGSVPKQVYSKLSDIVGGGRSMLEIIDQIEAATKSGHLLDAKRIYEANAANLGVAFRKYSESGANITGPELEMKADLQPSFVEGALGKAGIDLGYLKKLDAIRKTITRSVATRVESAAPGSIQADPDDPLWGRYTKQAQDQEDNSPQGMAKQYLSKMPVHQ